MEEGYPRNRVIIEGLRRNGVEVIECHEDFWKGTEEKLEGLKDRSRMLKKLGGLLRTYPGLIRKFRKVGPYDALIVGYAGHMDIFLARVLNLFRRKPLIFDAFLSLYDTAVVDRGVVPPGTIKARLLRLLDTWSCRIADAVLLDTEAHVDYFVKEFHLPREKFYPVPVGSSLPLHHSLPFHDHPPMDSESSGGTILNSLPPCSLQRIKYGVPGTNIKESFNVLYFGSYIPLHGVDIILKAAAILQGEKDISFQMIGKGQLLAEMKGLTSEMDLKNVIFVDKFMEEEELARHILEADICLGIFGMTEKALRVIPCKVYNALALGKPLITAMTPATEGVLTHMKNAFLCRPGDPEDLAQAILRLRNDPSLRGKIALCGQEYYRNNFSSEAIGKRVRDVICATSAACISK